MKNNWQIKKLSELYQIGSSRRVLKSQWRTDGVPFYRGREITKIAIDGFVDNDLFISEEHYLKLAKLTGVPVAGDIVITAIGTIGNAYIVQNTDRFYFKDASVLWMKKTSETSSEFIRFWLKSPLFFNQLDRGNGATVDTLTIQKLQNVSLYVPALKEQKQIVSILDKAFADIKKAKNNAEKNLKNANELFESYLQIVFENKGDDWEEKTLGDVYDVRDGTHDSPKYQPEGFPLITSKNLKKDELNYDNVKYIKEIDYLNINKRSGVDVGDILFAMIGTIGNPVVIKSKPDFAIKNVALFKVPKTQSSYFLKYYLDSKLVIDKLLKDAKGTTQKFVGLGYLRGFKISLPSLEKQEKIVKKLNDLSTQTKKLEVVYQQKIKDLDELKKSILNKAFTGEL